jgi:hypothetical protein
MESYRQSKRRIGGIIKMSVETIEEKIIRLNKRLTRCINDFGEDSSIVQITKWDIEEAEEELEHENFINRFSKRVSKAVRLMKKIEDADLDEQVPDSMDVEKVRSLINREETELTIKMKKLEDELAIVKSISSDIQYNHPNRWYRLVKRWRD